MSDELTELRALLALADRFRLGEITIVARGKDTWAVSNGSGVLNTLGEWEYEPMPSNRDEDFITRTRFSRDEAFRLACEFLAAGE